MRRQILIEVIQQALLVSWLHVTGQPSDFYEAVSGEIYAKVQKLVGTLDVCRLAFTSACHPVFCPALMLTEFSLSSTLAFSPIGTAVSPYLDMGYVRFVDPYLETFTCMRLARRMYITASQNLIRLCSLNTVRPMRHLAQNSVRSVALNTAMMSFVLLLLLAWHAGQFFMFFPLSRS
jgi:hypothetical protein